MSKGRGLREKRSFSLAGSNPALRTFFIKRAAIEI